MTGARAGSVDCQDGWGPRAERRSYALLNKPVGRWGGLLPVRSAPLRFAFRSRARAVDPDGLEFRTFFPRRDQGSEGSMTAEAQRRRVCGARLYSKDQPQRVRTIRLCEFAHRDSAPRSRSWLFCDGALVVAGIVGWAVIMAGGTGARGPDASSVFRSNGRS